MDVVLFKGILVQQDTEGTDSGCSWALPGCFLGTHHDPGQNKPLFVPLTKWIGFSFVQAPTDLDQYVSHVSHLLSWPRLRPCVKREHEGAKGKIVSSMTGGSVSKTTWK